MERWRQAPSLQHRRQNRQESPTRADWLAPVSRSHWLVVPDGWIGGEVKLELEIAPVSATQPHRYTVHRTLALDHGAERMPTGEHLLARVKGLPAPEQRGKARSQRAGQRRGSREIRDL
jgi:hypothetical protein